MVLYIRDTSFNLGESNPPSTNIWSATISRGGGKGAQEGERQIVIHAYEKKNRPSQQGEKNQGAITRGAISAKKDASQLG